MDSIQKYWMNAQHLHLLLMCVTPHHLTPATPTPSPCSVVEIVATVATTTETHPLCLTLAGSDIARLLLCHNHLGDIGRHMQVCVEGMLKRPFPPSWTLVTLRGSHNLTVMWLQHWFCMFSFHICSNLQKLARHERSVTEVDQLTPPLAALMEDDMPDNNTL